jgi:serine protease Do
MAPGSSVKLSVRRKGEDKTLTLTLGKMPEERQANAAEGMDDGSGRDVPHLGLTIAPAKDVSGAGNDGVVVTGVEPDGAAAEHGMQSGDVILEVGGKAVANVADVKKAIADAREAGKGSVLMRVKSGEATRFIALPVKQA